MELPVARYLIQTASFSSGQILGKSLVLVCICDLKFASLCSQKIELSCDNMYRTNQDNFSGLLYRV